MTRHRLHNPFGEPVRVARPRTSHERQVAKPATKIPFSFLAMPVVMPPHPPSLCSTRHCQRRGLPVVSPLASPDNSPSTSLLCPESSNHQTAAYTAGPAAKGRAAAAWGVDQSALPET